MKITRDQAEDLMWPFAASKMDGFEVLENAITDTGRWSVYKRLVFRHESGLWAFDYERPATECQEVEPLPDVVECYAVAAVQITTYEAAKS
jgi:hypothetical protein